jgi:hypothetical protein
VTRDRRPLRVAASAALVAATCAVLVVAATPRPAAASPALVQTGTVGRVTGSGGVNVTLTLPSASTAGTLLVATVVSGGDTSSISGPVGWTRAVEGGNDPYLYEADIYYYVNNPGGITTAKFSDGGDSSFIEGQITEWSGMATATPVNVTKGAGTSSSASSFTVTPTSSTADTDELGIAVFEEHLSSAATNTFTPGGSWSNLGSTGATSTTDHYVGASWLPINVSVTATASESATQSGKWVGAVATFKDACTGGSLTVTPPGTVTFNPLTLSGVDQTTSISAGVTVSDMTGGGLGWSLQATSTQFSDGNGHTLPTTATTVTSASASAATGNCTTPTNSIGYPVNVPAGAGPPSAVKIFDAATNTGGGPATVTVTFQLSVPAKALATTYTSTWTLTVASGP